VNQDGPSVGAPPSAVLDAVSDVVVAFDGEGGLTGWNRALTETTGYGDETLASLSAEGLFEDVDPVRAAVDEALETGSATTDATLVTDSGDALVCEFTLAPTADAAPATDGTDATPVVGVGREVTGSRCRARRCERYETVLDGLVDAVYAIEADGTIVYVNDRYVEMKGLPREDLLGTDVDDLVTETTVEKADEVREALNSGDREVGTVEYEFLTADGERFPAELRFGEVRDPDSDLGRVGTIRDVTERVERERRLQRQNERLDEFASVVSHDLRNPLNVAQGRLELARDECDSDQLDAVADAHDRMRGLIDDLLALSRQREMSVEPTAVSLPRVARGCWSAVARPTATFVVETDATVRADERRLRRLLENLLRNCVEHGSTISQPAAGDSVEHGSVEGPTRPGEPGDDTSRAVLVRVGGLADGFFVEDDGPGIEPEDRDRVFEAGYSTSDEGTGFGLRIVREVADAHGWEIDVVDGTDGGARFEITGVTVE
jgi:PAS domain S-box-containing protein